MQSFIFGANQEAKTPEELAKRRSVQDALVRAALSRTPQNVGEGLSQMGQAIAYRIMANKNNAAEKAGRESADQAFGGIDFSSLFGGGGAAYPSAVAGGASPTSGAATGTTPTTGATVDISGDKQKFIDTLLPAAIEHGQRIGVDPRIIVAQAAQETGWGKSAPGNNFFGIKSHGQGGGQNLTTHEVINGQRVKINDSFRTFASPQDSVAGYADFIGSNKRYRPMREAQGLDAQLQALGASGYATDPNYARSVGAIARSINLPQQSQPQGVQVASLDPSAGLEQAYAPQQKPNGAAATINMVAPQSPYPEQGQVPPHDFTNNPQLSAGAGMPFQGGQPQPQEMASIQPQQQADPKAAIRDALLRQNDMMLGGALAPQGQATQQVADASGAFPPAPTGQPFAGQQGGDARGAMVQKLMQAAQNPWLNDNQRAMVNALLQKQMEQGDPANTLDMEYKRAQIDALKAKPTTKYGFTTLPDGTVLRTNEATGELAPAYQSTPKPTTDMQNYEAYASDERSAGRVPLGRLEYEQSLKKAGANSTVINNGENSNKFVEKSDEAAAKRFDDIVTAGQSAPQTMSDMQQLLDLGAQIGTGKGAQVKAAIGPYAQALGLNIDGLSDIQAYEAITSRLAPQMRAVGSGSSSDRDVAMFLQSLPNLRNTPGGNEIIANTMRAVAQNKINAANIARQAQSGAIKWQEADKQISELPNPYEIFKQFQSDAGKANGGWNDVGGGVRIRVK